MRFFTVVALWVLASLPIACSNTSTPSKNGSAAATSTATASSGTNGTTTQPLEPWDLPVQLDKTIKIGKIYDFLNDPKMTATGKDPVLIGEFKFFNYGAATGQQIAERRGHYYIVVFTNNGPACDLTIRMDFRQLLSRDRVNTLAVDFKDAKGSYKQQFVIAGDMYQTYGDVNSWRISVVKDGKIVAQKKSYIW